MSDAADQLRFGFARARHRLATRVRARLANDDFISLLVLATPRTGSYLLLDYLRCIEGVSMTDEVLNDQRVVGIRSGASTDAKAAHLQRCMRALGGPVRGAKLMLFPGYPDALDVLCADESRDLRFVVLYRRDVIAQYVSHQQAKESGRWTSTTATSPNAPVHLDEAQLSRYVESIQRGYERASAGVRGRPVTYLAYEELTEDPLHALRPVAEMVSASLTEVHSPLRKQGSQALEDRVDDPDVLERLRALGLDRFDPTRPMDE